MSDAATPFVPDYRDQPERSCFWRTDTPQRIELRTGYVGVFRWLRHHRWSILVTSALYAAFNVGMGLWFDGGRIHWRSLIYGVFLIAPGWWILGAFLEGKQGLSVYVYRDALHVHRQDALRSRWQRWQSRELSRAYVNWEGWIVLCGRDGKTIGKFGGGPSRTDMKWLARLIRGRLELRE